MSDTQGDVTEPEVPADAPAPVEPAAPEAPPEVPAEPTPAVPVLQQAASSADEPEDEPDADEDETTVSLEDAARAVVLFVEAHRTIGDADLAAAVADVKAALPAQDAQA
jgi:hypothetical protein